MIVGSLSSSVKARRVAPTTPSRGFGLDGILDRAKDGKYAMAGNLAVLFASEANGGSAQVSMDDLIGREHIQQVMSVAMARELLGDDGAGLSDNEIEMILRHAQKMAHELIDTYLKKSGRKLHE